MEPSTSISFQIYPSSSAFSYSRRRRTRRSSGSCKSLFGLEDHFLDCCHLCKKHLGGGGGGGGKDIYMYKGDTPFCSEDCRQEQIDLDETKENNTKQLNQTKKSKNSGPVIYSETKSSRATTTAVSAS